MVVLPDFQGMGIGTAFEQYTSQHYSDKGWGVNVTTTTPALVNALRRSKKWKLVRFGRMKSSWKDFNIYGKDNDKKHLRAQNHLLKTLSKNRVTYSFNFIK